MTWCIYPSLDIYVVFERITDQLSVLHPQLISAVAGELRSGAFSSQEYSAAKSSYYYRHINFTKIEQELISQRLSKP